MATLLTPVPPTDRVGRYPKHTFNIKTRPWTVNPFMLAPVLPGESLTNLFFEARCVTDPILNRIIGWKKEFYFFYVGISDLMNEQIKNMFIDPTNTDLTATMGVAANNTWQYQAKGGIPYTELCLKRIMEVFFRDQGEAWDYVKTTDGIPICQIKDVYWMDTLTDKDLMPEGGNISAATDAGDLDRLMDAYEQLRALGLSSMTYADFLRSYGISVPEEAGFQPELLCRFTEFQYPSNTIDPTDGSAQSAVSWVFKNGNRDPKFFKEPGFIVGLSVTRPKRYYGGLAGSLASFMGRAWDWMPSYLATMPETSLKQFQPGTGPLGDRLTDSDAYWVDMRDLLLYGDQWQNVVPFPANTSTPINVGAEHIDLLPYHGSLNYRHVDENIMNSYFVNAGANTIRSDGYVSLSIKGAQVDYTNTNFATM